MTKRPIQVFSRIFAVWAFLTILSVGLLRAESPQESVGYDFYTAPDGTSYVAVGFRGVAIPTHSLPEVVFLVDTSASQVGQVRLDALSALRSVIDNLPKGSMVQILTMDVDTESLTPTFVAKDSPELAAAVQKLQRRVPLGATDMNRGLDVAKAAFAGRDPSAKRAVVYLGDGRSMAKTIDVPVFERQVKDYVAQRIPFTACAVGIQSNLGLVAAMANQTGGNLINMNDDIQRGVEAAIDQAEANKDEFVEMPNFGKPVGKRLADAITATVVWPDRDTYSFPEKWDIYPKTLQPIRSDRETIIVGKTDKDGLAPFSLKLKGATPGNEMELGWNFAPSNALGTSAGNKFLAAVVDLAARDKGLTMPIVGWDSLDRMHDGFIANITDQLNKADVALRTGNPQQALVLVRNVLRLDPGNGTAQRIHDQANDALEGGQVDQGTFNLRESEIAAPYGAQADAAAPQAPVASADSDDAPQPLPAMVDSVMKEQSASTQKIQNEVRRTINEATALMSNDPDGALQTLKMTMAMVRDNTALEPDQRNQMLDRLGNAVKQTQHEQFLNEQRRQRADENEAKIRERERSLQGLEESRVKAVQIFDRFAALMNAGEYKVAVTVADVAKEMLPEDTTPFTAERLASMTGYIMEYNDLRHRRHVGFVESLMISERSFISIPEEPPLTYIDPEQWLLLSERRKERYAVADLSQAGPAEKKISRALDRNIDLELDESQTFEDLFNMITDKNPGLNIGIDPKGAGALGITSSSPVVREPIRYHGIKLRSALRLILSEQDLTYCIKNEVLLITSEDEAKKYMSVKVYPMADLVVDPTPLQGSSSASGAGSSGSLGGMMNGGGMSGSGGMGGMGGGMGGMGGGMWNNTSDSIRRIYGASKLNGKAANGFSGMFSIPPESRKNIENKAKKAVDDAFKANDPHTYWECWFQSADADEEVVKEVVNRLRNHLTARKHPEALKRTGKKNDKQQQAVRDVSVENQIVAVIESAILADAVQPWMYEALALALYVKGAPKKELERAVLSAADFCENAIDLMNIGLFMESVGLNERAFQMYKQSLEFLTPKREFYAAALRVAREINDEEALRWICQTILSQEWEGELGRNMVENALDAVRLLQLKMERTGRLEEAAALKLDVDEARRRDCVVTVEWTGNAGLDLMVREPTDSFCWFNNPRTTSGGLLQTKPVGLSGTLAENSGVKRLTYVCPKGFNGRYAVVLRKDWGVLAGNRVKFAVQSNIIPGEITREGTAIDVPEEGLIVCFDLEDGRRTEPVEEGMLEVAELRMSVAQQQLARNNALKRLSDDALLGQIIGGSGETSSSSNYGGSRSRNGYPLYGQSVVGYRPVITMLDEGVNLTSNAVVSADRRYVRISPSVEFSDIRKVTKYNMTTGGSEDMDSGSGGGASSSGGSTGFGGGSGF